MSASDVSNKCVDICFTEREDLVKRCMNNALDNMHRGSSDEVPSDSTIFSYCPSKERFVDYASQIMKVDTPPKDIMKAMMVPILEKFARLSRNKKRITFDPEEDDDVSGPEPSTEPVVEPSRTKRPRLTKGDSSEKTNNHRNSRNTKNTKDTRGSGVSRRTRSCLSQALNIPEVPNTPQVLEGSEVSEEVQDEEDIVTEPGEHEYQECEDVEEVQITESPESTSSTEKTENIVESPRKYPELPVPLGHTSSGSMTCVSKEYFPDAEFVFPGIYILPGDSGYVLFCVDNGRYSNSWIHNNNVTTLTWVTANKDKSRSALRAISESKNVFVFRKISGEINFRYVGKVFRSGNLDRRAGTVELAVC